MRCRWCDTKYAWSAGAGRRYAVEQLEEQILQRPTPYVVITGGEPMLVEGLGEFVGILAEAQRHVTIETSGIAFVEGLSCDLMSISPKLSNSRPAEAGAAAEHEARRLNMEALQQLIEAYEYQLKFVVDGPQDLDEIAACLDQLKEVNPYKVYLMPQAQTRAELVEKSQMLAEYCLQTGFAMSPRLQVLLWQGQRGR